MKRREEKRGMGEANSAANGVKTKGNTWVGLVGTTKNNYCKLKISIILGISKYYNDEIIE